MKDAMQIQNFFREKNVANQGILKDEIKKFKKDEKSA
jgi:hypothetical protein